MTKIQKLVNKCDEINCDSESDCMELEEAYSELGEYLYTKSLEKKEYSVLIANPRSYKNK